MYLLSNIKYYTLIINKSKSFQQEIKAGEFYNRHILSFLHHGSIMKNYKL